MTTPKTDADFYDQFRYADVLEPRHQSAISWLEGLSGNLLEVGCAQGMTLRGAHARYGDQFQYFGVDITPEQIAKNQDTHLHLSLADAASLPFEDNFFDAIFLLEVLEHTRDHVAALREISRVLKVDGRLVLTVPNAAWPIRFLPKALTHYERQYQPVDYDFSFLEIRRLAKLTNLKIKKVLPSGPILGERTDVVLSKLPLTKYFTKRIAVWMTK